MSSPASICIRVTPVSTSPASIARWIGAAPRQRGSSEAWMLRQPRRRQRQQPGRQDQAVGGDDDRLGRGGGERRLRRRRLVGEAAVEAQAARLGERQSVLEGERLHRRGLGLHAAAGRTVRLAEHEHDLVPGGVQPLQRDAGEFRRAGERQTHSSGAGLGARLVARLLQHPGA